MTFGEFMKKMIKREGEEEEGMSERVGRRRTTRVWVAGSQGLEEEGRGSR